MTDLRQAAQQALEALERIWEGGLENLSDATHERVMEALSAALAEPEQEPVRLQCTTCGTVYADGVPPQVPEQEPQTTHWEGCEAVHPECRKPEPIQVSPTTFIQTVLYKEDTIGRPTIWTQWPNEEKNT